jgi:HEAT repeat protein
LIIVEGNKTPENIKPKEAVHPLINALKDEDEQLVVVNY